MEWYVFIWQLRFGPNSWQRRLQNENKDESPIFLLLSIMTLFCVFWKQGKKCAFIVTRKAPCGLINIVIVFRCQRFSQNDELNAVYASLAFTADHLYSKCPWQKRRQNFTLVSTAIIADIWNAPWQKVFILSVVKNIASTAPAISWTTTLHHSRSFIFFAEKQTLCPSYSWVACGWSWVVLIHYGPWIIWNTFGNKAVVFFSCSTMRPDELVFPGPDLMVCLWCSLTGHHSMLVCRPLAASRQRLESMYHCWCIHF